MSLALDLPLAGTQLIEASAGTGKTWTIAGLYLRALIERRLELREILVVTFTRAATDELKERLRRRLAQAADLAEVALRAGPAAAAAHLRDVREQALARADTETEFAAHAIVRGLAEEGIERLARRLRLAAVGMDEAAIHTIHGYCQRVLREQAFASGEALDAGELIGSDRDLLEQIAADFWRLNASEPTRAADFAILVERVGSAAQLARSLAPLLDADLLVHPRAPLAVDADQLPAAARAEEAARARLFAAWREFGEGTLDGVRAHTQAKRLDGRSYRNDWVAARIETCAAPLHVGELPEDRGALAWFGTRKLGAAAKAALGDLPNAFTDAVDAWSDAAAALAAARALRWPVLLAEARTHAREQLDLRKRRAARQSYDDLIQRLHAAIVDPQQGGRLAAALHDRHPVVLVDEFQDTDARQFEIFRRQHAARPGGALILVGDPKQAIYRFRGGDIEAYLRAAADAAERHALMRNYRSSPAMLDAVAAAFSQGDAENAFVDARIRFQPVEAGGRARDDDVRVDGAPIVPLTVWHLPDLDARPNKEDARALLAAGCAEAIVQLLRKARAGEATVLQHGERVPLTPRHLAVLVAENKEALLMQDALAARGVASATIRQDSVFAGEEARDVLVLLRGLESHDEAGLRAALATRLLGRDAQALAALADPARPELWQRELRTLDTLRRLWHERGVLALFERVLEMRAAAILDGRGGERRLTNYLQLAELLQTASAHRFGHADLIDWLRRRIEEADERNEEEQLRLESDADRVQIATIHVSKGLEYDLVFLPFTALAPARPNRYPRLLEWHADGARQRWLRTQADVDDADFAAAKAQAEREELAERVRVFYVALTRARYACWLSWDAIGKGDAPAALAQLWHGGAMPKDTGEARAALARLQEGAPAVVRIDALPAAETDRLDAPATAPLPPARRFATDIDTSWWIASFSQLRDGERVELDDRAGSDDEASVGSKLAESDDDASTPDAGIADWPRGERFGTAVHEILERTDFAAWRDHADALAPASEREAIRARLRRHALAPPEREQELQRVVARMIGATLNVRLPAGAVLADLPANARRAELPFHFAIGGALPERLIALLREYGYQQQRAGFARVPGKLAGLMTGVVDLVYRHDGRWWIVDYKTNWLGPRRADYQGEALAAAVREHDYDLQYLIYTLALHRWLRARLGAGFDYERDFGGAVYLFLRGLARDGSAGVHVDRPPRALIDALDVLLAPAGEHARC
ncbi:exodeoxyribonuclease V subunit beta [Dokdonella sp.]|uniref:exodeoxyribonuclease V subunit beta n=1 Tax=Dokdonella sp. TaxID=2291710 RepID=UPI001AFD7280|nr:exodeoxyribonuclease V subunit beta [Dokdonella sp.]MBO9661604.1 exodeoxyribonuclease V subunit beta [Dokdonella sp.]